MAIMRDTTLTEDEKSKKRQELMMGTTKWATKPEDSPSKKDGGAKGGAESHLPIWQLERTVLLVTSDLTCGSTGQGLCV